jgi:hypoxanthine phosphoribosyltransferase
MMVATPPAIHPDIEKVLLTEEQIQERVRELGSRITADYAGREITLIGVLRGSVFFLTDLARAIDLPVRIDFLAVSAFVPRGEPGVVRISKDLDASIEDAEVLLVEDIVDTGLTLRYLLRSLAARRPRSLEVCAFADKTTRRLADVHIRYRGFEIPDRFVVGYGLDYQQFYRNLPYVGVVKAEVFRG